MNIRAKRPFRSLRSLAIGILGACSLVVAAHADLPAVQRSGNIEYVSGGIGSDEAAAFKIASPRWPLTLEFGVEAQPAASYASDVKVTIRGAGNPAPLETTSAGPFMLVKLPPGDYTINAVFAGRTITHTVSVTAGNAAHASFIWPAAGQ